MGSNPTRTRLIFASPNTHFTTNISISFDYSYEKDGSRSHNNAKDTHCCDFFFRIERSPQVNVKVLKNVLGLVNIFILYRSQPFKGIQKKCFVSPPSKTSAAWMYISQVKYFQEAYSYSCRNEDFVLSHFGLYSWTINRSFPQCFRSFCHSREA